MTPGLWGIIAVIVFGVAAVGLAWWRDARHQAHAIRDLTQAPRTPIPGFQPSSSPRYVTEAEILASTPAPSELDADQQALLAGLDDAATLPGGAPDGYFFNAPAKGLAVLVRPHVLVSEAPLTTDRELLAVLAAASKLGGPLVVVAPAFSEDAIATLRANAVRGKLANIPVVLTDPVELRRAVALTGGRLVASGDLASGWLPRQAWGTCLGWVADLDHSRIIVDRTNSTNQPH